MVTLTPRKESSSPHNGFSQAAANAIQLQTLLFALASAVNGSLVGVTGPSMQTLAKSTSLDEAALGRVIFANRLAKLVGSFAWTSFAKALQHKTAPCGAPALLSVCCTVVGTAALIIATLRQNALALQVSLVAAGAAYGVCDTAITLLTVWSVRQPTPQRTHVALLNVGFTCGALVTPAVIALALRFGGSCYVGFYALGGCALCTAPALLLEPYSITPPPPTPRDAANSDEQEVSGGGTAASGLRSLVMVMAMSAILFCVTGCEHAMATWLPSYGHHVGGLALGEMALMSTGFWSMICLGRILWALISAALTSGFPPLLFDGLLMLLSSALISEFYGGRKRGVLLWNPSALLWCGTLGLGFGCSSSLPCAITLPSEAGVELTPTRLLILNLAGSAGEMLLPYIVGLAFDHGAYWALGAGLVGLESVVVVCTLIAWRVATFGRAREHQVSRSLSFSGEETEMTNLLVGNE